MSNNGDDDQFSNLEFPEAFSHTFSTESFLSSPEWHKDKADWKLEEGNDFEVIRDSKLLPSDVLKISWNTKSFGGDRLSMETVI
jgi:hypothetical protein